MKLSNPHIIQDDEVEILRSVIRARERQLQIKTERINLEFPPEEILNRGSDSQFQIHLTRSQ